MIKRSGTGSAGAALLMAVWLAGAGCAGREVPGEPGRRYPVGLETSQTLDVQVRRVGTLVVFTNTSARSLGPGVMWINSQFGRDIDEVSIGETVSFNLYSFQNEFGESFRGGGFFATQRPDIVVRAEIERGEELLSLVVVGGGAE